MRRFPLVRFAPVNNVTTDANTRKKKMVVVLIILVVLTSAIVGGVCVALMWKSEDLGSDYEMNITAVLMENMNLNVDPCEDFYEFACGGFPNQYKIPPHRVCVEFLNLDIPKSLLRNSNHLCKLPLYKTVRPDLAPSQMVEHKLMVDQQLRERRDADADFIISSRTIKVVLCSSASVGPDRYISRATMLRDEITDKLESIVTSITIGQEAQYSSAQKLAKFHHSCMKLQTTKNGSGSALIEVIKTLSSSSYWPSALSTHGSTYEMLAIIKKQYEKQLLISIERNTIGEPSARLILGLGKYSSTYYLHSRFKDVQESYKRSILDVTLLLADDQGNPNKMNTTENRDLIDEIYEFECEIAKISRPEIRRNDRNHDIVRLTALEGNNPNINWNELVGASSHYKMKVKKDDVNYVKNLLILISKYRRRTVENYLIWRVLQLKLPHFARYSDVQDNIKMSLVGASELPNPSFTCVTAALRHQSLIGHHRIPCYGIFAGDLFVEHYFTDVAKTQVQAMITNIAKIFYHFISVNMWLDKKSRNTLQDRLDSLTFGIGNTYEAYRKQRRKCEKAKVLTNDEIIEAIEELYNTNPDEEEHLDGMAAYVNAWYDPKSHLVVLASGILQEPLYHPRYHASLRYGIAGTIAGHEIIHAFDVRRVGKMNDLDNNIKNRFSERVNCFDNQYDQFCYPSWNMCVNTNLTKDETISDNHGTRLAYAAYENYLESSQTPRFSGKIQIFHCSPPQALKNLGLEEFTNEQMFFISYASFHCANMSPLMDQLYLLVNPHAPRRNRVNGVMQNMEAFSKAFQCSANSTMNKNAEMRCQVW